MCNIPFFLWISRDPAKIQVASMQLFKIDEDAFHKAYQKYETQKCDSHLYKIFKTKEIQLKGTTLQKLTGDVSYINRDVYHTHKTTRILFLKLKGTCSLNRRKPDSAALRYCQRRILTGVKIRLKQSLLLNWRPASFLYIEL
jgi:hypothetical protein